MAEYKPQLTLGNLITIGVLLVGGAVTWGAFTSTASSSASSIKELEIRVRHIEINIASSLARIEAKLEKIERGTAQ